MRILALNGSHRGDKGYTRFLIDKLLQGAIAAGAECEVITLAKLRINRCLSCGKCNTQEHYLKCVFDDDDKRDDVRQIFNKMATSDIIIFATPIYIFTMSGLLKTFLERLYATGNAFDLKLTKTGLLFHHIPDFCSKPFVVLICCDNIERETPQNLISYFRTWSRFHDAPQVGLLVRNAGRLAGHGQDPEAVKKVPKLEEVYNAYERAGLELATFGRIRHSTQRTANQSIIPIPRLFRLLAHLRPFKAKMVEQARRMARYSEGDV